MTRVGVTVTDNDIVRATTRDGAEIGLICTAGGGLIVANYEVSQRVVVIKTHRLWWLTGPWAGFFV